MSTLESLRLQRIVDRLLAPWQAATGPGVTIGVVRDDTLVLHRSAGMANIELGVPIGPGTTFRIASVSKQFTCAAILMLAAEDRLRIEDDLRDHIAGFPDLGHRITLAHLMHNTSGIRDMLEIMRLGGVDLRQPCHAADLLDAVCRQRGLNFVPGTRYLYSNSNFMLLGRIVEQVSGESLAAFLDSRIFAPLGMSMTRHTPLTTELVPGLASGYFPAPSGALNGWRHALHNFPLHGEGGLVSSVEDLALWHAQFGLPNRYGDALAAALMTTTPFLNGAPNTYARGLRTRDWRGVRTVGHDGLWPGFKTSFVRLPDHHAAVICISNDATSDPHELAFQVVDALIEGAPGVHAVPAMPDWAEQAALEGCYLDRVTGATVDIGRDAKQPVTASVNGVATFLLPTEDGRLATNRGSGDFTLRFDGKAIEVERDAGVVGTLHRVAPGARLPPDLPGRYANADTAATWTITATGAGAALRIAGPVLQASGPWEIAPIDGDDIRIYTPMTLFRGWLDTRVVRDGGGGIVGLHVDGGRVKGLVFERLAASDA
jgi:CubicO group peptidase (beta-lactamase class C family)